MRYRLLGKTGLNISEVSFGCWTMGGDYWGGADDRDSVAAVREAAEQGINFFDTAELYGDGHSEKVLGLALQGIRDKVCIASKVWTNHMRGGDVQKACENSLRRLRTDYLDLYFIHYPSETVPLRETMEAMLKLRESGKIRAIGVSNFSGAQLEEALKIGRCEVIQPCYSLLWRFVEKDVIPLCLEHNIGVVAYSPLAQGLLTGKFHPGWQFKEGDHRGKTPLFKPGRFEEALRAAESLKPFADKYGRTQGQIAINWLIARPGIVSAIVGARDAAQVKENAAASGWDMSPEDYAAIDKISREFTDALPRFKSFFNDSIVQE